MPPTLEDLQSPPSSPPELGLFSQLKKGVQSAVHKVTGMMDMLLHPIKNLTEIWKRRTETRKAVEAVTPGMLEKTELKAEIPAPETKPSTPETTTESHDPYRIAAEKSQELLKKKSELIAADFFAISQSISPEHPSNASLSELAGKRLEALKKQQKFDHDEQWLKENHCSENITNQRFTDAKDLMEKFLRSPAHRRNQLGTSKGIGIAVDYETGMAVVLFDKGKPLPEQEVPEKEKDEVLKKVLSLPENSSSIEPYSPFIDALKKEAEQAVIKVSMLPQEQGKKGKFVCLEKDGKKVVYTVKERPPISLVREDNGKEKEVPFEKTIQDFSS